MACSPVALRRVQSSRLLADGSDAVTTELVRERPATLAGAGEVWLDGEGRYNRVEQPV